MSGNNGYQTAFNLGTDGELSTQTITVKITLVPNTLTSSSGSQIAKK